LQVPALLQSHLLAIAEGKPSEAKLFGSQTWSPIGRFPKCRLRP